MSFPIVAATDIYKSYETASHTVEVLRGITMHLQAGSLCGLCGSSGSGKSTILKIFGLLEKSDSGALSLMQHTITPGLPERQLLQLRSKNIGFIFQSFELLTYLTARENVALPLEILGTKTSDALQKAEVLLNRVGLSDRADHFPTQLSGGQMQRVAIARSLVHSPQLILADEPTGNLDSKTGTAIIELLKEVASQGPAVLVATHSEELLRACDTVFYLKDGIIQSPA